MTWKELTVEQKLDILNWKVDRIMTEQADYDADIAALVAFLTTTLPDALSAIQAQLSNAGVTDLSALDTLVNTNLPAVQATLNTIVPPVAGNPVPQGTAASQFKNL